MGADLLSCCDAPTDVPGVPWDAAPEAGKDKPFPDVTTGLTNVFCGWRLLGGVCFTFTCAVFALLIAARNSPSFLTSPVSCFSFWNATGSSSCKESQDPNPTTCARASWWICISTHSLAIPGVLALEVLAVEVVPAPSSLVQ